MDDFYNAPGAAAATGIQSYMMQELARRRQAMLDQITQAKEQRLTASDAADLQMKQQEMKLRQAALDERTQAAKDTLTEKAHKDFLSELSTLAPGDIPSADMVAKGNQFGMGHLFPGAPAPQGPEESGPPPQAAPSGMAAMPSGGVQPQGPEPPPMPAPSPVASGMNAPYAPIRFLGMPAQRKANDEQAQISNLVDQISELDPGTPEFIRAAAQYEMLAKKPLSASMVKATAVKPATQVSMRQNPHDPNGFPQMSTPNGDWVDVKGDVPKDAHWITQVPPKDTSAADASREAAKAARDAALLATVKERAFKRLDQMEKPYNDTHETATKLGTGLSQDSNVADSMIAEQVLRLGAGGVGSGLRLNNVLVDQVIKKSRTNWASLQMALQRWSTSGGKDLSLFITPEQRQQVRELGKAYYDESREALLKVLDARRTINTSPDPDAVYQAVANLDERMLLGPGSPYEQTAKPDAGNIRQEILKGGRGGRP